MPSCFSLTRKSDPAAGPVALNKVDEEMCKHFNVPVHPSIYCNYWYTSIGLRLSIGKSFDYVEGYFKGQAESTSDNVEQKVYANLVEITKWLRENFTVDSWTEIGKR